MKTGRARGVILRVRMTKPSLGVTVNQAVILSAAKDHLERIERRKMILRCAQDDKPSAAFHFRAVHAG